MLIILKYSITLQKGNKGNSQFLIIDLIMYVLILQVSNRFPLGFQQLSSRSPACLQQVSSESPASLQQVCSSLCHATVILCSKYLWIFVVNINFVCLYLNIYLNNPSYSLLRTWSVCWRFVFLRIFVYYLSKGTVKMRRKPNTPPNRPGALLLNVLMRINIIFKC